MKANGNRKKETNFLSGYLGPIVLFIAVMIYLVTSYGVKMDRKIKQQVYDSYIEELTTVAQLYNREIYSVNRVAQYISKEIIDSGHEDLFDEYNVGLIKAAAEFFDACNVYLVKTDFTVIDINGDTYSSTADIPGLENAINELDSHSRLVEDKDGHITFLVVTPISTNINLNGYVAVEYRSSIMETLTKDPRYSANKTFALVSSDGRVVELCGAQSDICSLDANIIDISDASFSDGSYITFKQGITNSRTGHVRIIRGDEDKYLFYAPIENYYASVVMLSNRSDVNVSFKSAVKDLKTFLITIGIAIGVVAVIVFGIGIFNKTKHHMESEDLQYKADTDQLTDLFNKSATERLIKEYIEGDGKDKISMLFVLDIDNFKKINDTQGHAFGDKVLSSLGHQIKSWFRVNDIIGRIGGDEFIIFIKDIKDPEAIKREGSRIMQFFEGFNVGDYTRYSPTASVGGAVFPNDADSFETLYKATDKAVYKSKHAGKNRVSFYADMNSEEREVVGNSEDPEARQGD